MFILGNLIITIANLANWMLMILWWLIVIRALISWVNPDPFNMIVQFLYQVTEPILGPIRRLLPPMAIDVSPIIAFMGIMVVLSFLITSLYELGERIKM